MSTLKVYILRIVQLLFKLCTPVIVISRGDLNDLFELLHFDLRNLKEILQLFRPLLSKKVWSEILQASPQFVVTHGSWWLLNAAEGGNFKFVKKAGILTAKIEKPSLVNVIKEMASS